MIEAQLRTVAAGPNIGPWAYFYYSNNNDCLEFAELPVNWSTAQLHGHARGDCKTEIFVFESISSAGTGGVADLSVVGRRLNSSSGRYLFQRAAGFATIFA